MLKIVLTVITVLVIGFVILVSQRPDSFRVERTTTIAAPAERVFAEVNDFRQWAAWSPYDKLDPAMKRTYDGSQNGVGARYSWSGNNEVGEGRTTITESRVGELIRIKLEFVRPFKATNIAEFTFMPQGDKTEVTWAMSGESNFMFKAVGLFMDMDKMVGAGFEQGLNNLKAVVETAPQS